MPVFYVFILLFYCYLCALQKYDTSVTYSEIDIFELKNNDIDNMAEEKEKKYYYLQ